MVPVLKPIKLKQYNGKKGIGHQRETISELEEEEREEDDKFNRR
jgi:hypothetical protein